MFATIAMASAQLQANNMAHDRAGGDMTGGDMIGGRGWHDREGDV